jgi:hypothetical protein
MQPTQAKPQLNKPPIPKTIDIVIQNGVMTRAKSTERKSAYKSGGLAKYLAKLIDETKDVIPKRQSLSSQRAATKNESKRSLKQLMQICGVGQINK